MPNLFASICAVLILTAGDAPPGRVFSDLSWAWLALVGAPVGTWLLGSHLARRALGAVSRRGPFRARLSLRRGRFLCLLIALGAYATLVHAGHWSAVVKSWVPPQVPLIAHLVALAPFVVTATAGLLPLSGAEQILAGESGRRRARAALELRPLVLPVIPYLILAGVLDSCWYFPELRLQLLTNPWVGAVATFSMLITVLMLSPFVVRFLFPSRSLPPGAFRETLEELAKKAGIRYRDIRVWDTGGRDLINACIAGPIGSVRYIFFTDGILRHFSPGELHSVFAHELGHARHHHFVIFFLVVIAFVLLIQGAAVWFPDGGSDLFWIGLIVLAFLYFRLGFGTLSRQLESQADLFGAELTGSTSQTALTLQQVGELTGGLTGRRGWRHHSIPRRMEILWRAALDPAYRRLFENRTRSYLTVVVLVFALSSVAGASGLLQEAQAPEHEKSAFQARLLFDECLENRARPLADPARETRQLHQARSLLLKAYSQVQGVRGPEARRQEGEILSLLTQTFEELGEGDSWDAVGARFLRDALRGRH